MTEIQTKLEKLYKKRAEAIEDMDITQKDIVKMNITKKYETKSGADFFQSLIESEKRMESYILEYDKEIEEHRKMLTEAELDFFSQNEYSGIQRKSKEESYEEAMEEIRTGKDRSIILREDGIQMLLQALNLSNVDD